MRRVLLLLVITIAAVSAGCSYSNDPGYYGGYGYDYGYYDYGYYDGYGY